MKKSKPLGMDINYLVPADVAEKFTFSADIPGPVFRHRDATGKLLYDFRAQTLTIEQCEDLIKNGFPYITRIELSKPKRKDKTDDKSDTVE